MTVCLLIYRIDTVLFQKRLIFQSCRTEKTKGEYQKKQEGGSEERGEEN